MLKVYTCGPGLMASWGGHLRDVRSLLVALMLGMNAWCAANGAVQSTTERMLLMHADGTYEGTCWEGVCPGPDWGSLAERYEGPARVLSVVLDLTKPSIHDYNRIDIYIWRDGQDEPGDVIWVMTDVDVSTVTPVWPAVGRGIFDLPEPICVDGVWWVGDWPSPMPYYFIAADLDGPGGGRSMVKIPDEWEDLPVGWQDVELVWGPVYGSIAALGIGAEVDSCPLTPVESQTWGNIKALFR
jgi:hypothetical protein